MKLLTFLIFFYPALAVNAECPRPTGGANMMLVTDISFPAPDGTSVTFKCEVGYSPMGSGTVTCSNGVWSKLGMKCEIKSCGAEDVRNGYVKYEDSADFGSFAYTVCNLGFTPVPSGVNKIYCGADGWEGRLSVCEPILCEPPNSMENGYFSPIKDAYEHSEVVTYACEGAHVLKGSKTLTCSDNGTFDRAPPTCVLVNCQNPVLEFGRISSGSPPYKYQTSVSLDCNKGYDLLGSSVVSCDINSEWKPSLPKCNPIECKAPEIPNGEVVGKPDLSYKFSEKVTLKCLEGYKLKGQSTLTCGEKSQWSEPLPECTPIQCMTPKVEGGVLVGGPRPSYAYKDSVLFECVSGYAMTGEGNLTCDDNSQWYPKLPVCTPVVIECEVPEVKNGRLLEGWRPSYKYPDSVVFECQSGYTMSEASARSTCALDSRWSPELPQCTRNGGEGLKMGLIILAVSFVAQWLLHPLY
ncbi:unnamed protein product [Knipowitschia caucasica]